MKNLIISSVAPLLTIESVFLFSNAISRIVVRDSVSRFILEGIDVVLGRRDPVREAGYRSRFFSQLRGYTIIINIRELSTTVESTISVLSMPYVIPLHGML